MPLYEYQCPSGHVTTEYRPVSRYREPLECPACGGVASRAILTPPRVFGDFAGYESPASGRWVEGRRARAEDLARTGCRPYEEGEREELQKRVAANERELDKVADAAVEQTLHELTK